MSNQHATLAVETVNWQEQLPRADWEVYQSVLRAVLDEKLPFAVGGGFAYSTYANRWRYTKDLDLFILPQHRREITAVLTRLGFTDYYAQVPYDRGWIYRGYLEGVIVDLIWEMANHHAQVDQQWIDRAHPIRIHDLQFTVLPLEELIWTKLYIVQRDRCDWPDLLTILYNHGTALDWSHLFDRVGEDAGLLSGLIAFFSWLCPEQAVQLPSWIWPRLGLAPPSEPAVPNDPSRVARIDSRDWFYPHSA